jgi:hypothetical protein
MVLLLTRRPGHDVTALGPGRIASKSSSTSSWCETRNMSNALRQSAISSALRMMPPRQTIDLYTSGPADQRSGAQNLDERLEAFCTTTAAQDLSAVTFTWRLVTVCGPVADCSRTASEQRATLPHTKDGPGWALPTTPRPRP